jgi:hypothetical protein
MKVYFWGFVEIVKADFQRRGELHTFPVLPIYHAMWF